MLIESALILVGLSCLAACTDAGETGVDEVLNTLEADDPNQIVPGEGALVRGQERRIDSVELVGDGKIVVRVTAAPKGDVFTDPCSERLELDVDETSETVTLTAWTLQPEVAPQLPDNWGCNDVGFEHVLDAVLTAPLAGREIIDGHSGDPAPVGDRSTALVPGWLPDRYIELYQASNDGVLEYAYGPDNGDFPAIRYTVARVDNQWNNLDSYRSREAVTVKDRTIQGFEGVLITSLEDGSRTFVFIDGDNNIHAITAQADVSLIDAERFTEDLQ